MASAQTVPIGVSFTLLDAKDPYQTPLPALPGETVRLVLGASPNWQNPDAGHKFVTDAKGEAHFTMNGQVEAIWRWVSIPFTPFSFPSRADHMKIGVELEHRFPLGRDGPQKVFRWLLTMDLNRDRSGSCSTVGFMGILTPDMQGRFTKPLLRQGSTESWKVPELNGQLIYGMSYELDYFRLDPDPDDTKRWMLKLTVKRRKP